MNQQKTKLLLRQGTSFYSIEKDFFDTIRLNYTKMESTNQIDFSDNDKNLFQIKKPRLGSF
jgi:hypothetical protein